MNKDNVLIIFIKAPRLALVKTRLQPDITPEQSLMLYQAMVLDLLASIDDDTNFDLYLFYWPEDGQKDLINWLGNSYKYIKQTGIDLGQRMNNAFIWAFERSYKKAVIIGSDIPTLEYADIIEAYSKLDFYDVVIGPCLDGGYYLIGVKEPYPALFQNIMWSTNSVYNNTIIIIQSMKLSLHNLAVRNDVDTFSDIIFLWEQLNNSEIKKINMNLGHTTEIIKNIFNNKKFRD